MAQPTGDILIVDDERSMREFLGIHLRRAGHRVEAAPGGSAALAAMKEREFDVVITDLRMPDVDGMVVLAEAKQLHPVWPRPSSFIPTRKSSWSPLLPAPRRPSRP